MSEEFSDENKHKYYSEDESEFIKNNKGEQIQILGIADNITKDLGICATKSRESSTLTKIY